MRAANQKPYTPREGRMIHDINRAWERLEKAEHERELALREELIRQEKLEQLAARWASALLAAPGMLQQRSRDTPTPPNYFLLMKWSNFYVMGFA